MGSGQFEDVSGVSGLDHPGDGRSFALLDFDRDGRPDIVTASANAPWIQLFRNTIGEPQPRRFFALRLVGANREASVRAGASNRDAIGARIDIEFADGSGFMREHRVGEGFAAQNSATMVIGLGANPRAESVALRWPSGARTRCDAVLSGSLLTVHEDASAAPAGMACVSSAYGPVAAAAAAPVAADAAETLLPRLSRGPDAAGRLRVMAAFATWCMACAKHAPLYAILGAAFGDRVDLVGLAMDAAETPQQVEAWARQHEVAYRVVSDLSAAERASVTDFARRVLEREALPYTIVTNDAGTVLWSDFGVPTVSDLRALGGPR